MGSNGILSPRAILLTAIRVAFNQVRLLVLVLRRTLPKDQLVVVLIHLGDIVAQEISIVLKRRLAQGRLYRRCLMLLETILESLGSLDGVEDRGLHRHSLLKVG